MIFSDAQEAGRSRRLRRVLHLRLLFLAQLMRRRAEFEAEMHIMEFGRRPRRQ